jgi:hypothetical protein
MASAAASALRSTRSQKRGTLVLLLSAGTSSFLQASC